MNHLGTSLGDLTIRGQVDVFQYASQMVCSSQGSSCKYKYLTEHSHTHSSRQLNRYTLGTTSIVTSSQQTSWFEPITFTLLFSSSTSAWHNYTAIPPRIYTTQTLKITSSSVLFHSRLSPANEDLLNRVATTWSLLSILLFIQHVVPCLGPFPPTVPTVITGRSSRRRYRSQQRSCAKAYPLPSPNLSIMFVPLALTRSRTTKTFIPFSRCARQPRLAPPPPIQTVLPFSVVACT